MSTPSRYFSSLTEELARRAARAAVSLLAPASDSLRHHLVDRLEQSAGTAGSFLADPVFEATFGWEQGSKPMRELSSTLLHPRLVQSMDAPPNILSEHRFPADVYPYVHQVKAWKQLRKEPARSVVVTSGTGSGKTECFLVPILDDLAREVDSKGRLAGVRALFLYPLNALINSQRDRLRAWMSGFGGDMRFCLYNGETPESMPAARQREEPAEVLSRNELRRDPASVLVTNSTMLEYMLVRRDDAPILQTSAGCLRWIVLDEAHTYLGSRAAEIALLLRRVLHAFAVDSSSVRFIATSATIADAGDDDSRRELQRFLADVAGVAPERVSVIEGRQVVPPLPSVGAGRSIASKSADSEAEVTPERRYDLLAQRADARLLRERIAMRPMQLSDVAALISNKPSTEVGPRDREQALSLLDQCVSAQKNGDTFVPLRGHFFHRTQSGLWACIDRQCSGRVGAAIEAATWGFGQVFLERRESCSACAAPAFEIVLCVECGAEYLLAEEQLRGGGISVLVSRQTQRDEDEFELEHDEPEQDEPDEAGTDSTAVSGVLARLLIGGPGEQVTSFRIDRISARICDDGGLVAHHVTPEPAERALRCVRCKKREGQPGELFRPARVGAPFFLRSAIPALLSYVQGKGLGRVAAPFDGRRLITFSDSRQGTARFAVQAQVEAERNYVRSFLYHQLAARRVIPAADAAANLEAHLAALRRLPQSPIFAEMIREKELALASADKDRPGVLSWVNARDELNKTPEVDQWMPRHWRNLALSDQARGNESHFCLLREFMRRPKRQNSLETLGMVGIRYPRLDDVSESSLPTAWRRVSLSLDDWRDFLKVALDFVVRGLSATDVPQGLLRWMSVPMRSRFLVGPDDDRTPGRLIWPTVRTRNIRARLPLLLFRAFEWDPEDQTARADVNDILRAAWIQVSRLLSRSQEGYQLNLATEVEFVELRQGWLCPVTRRIIDTVFRGLSPYLNQTVPLDQIRCRRVALPQLPYAFWSEPTGRNWTATERTRWLTEDATVLEARGLGFWTDYSDRIAAFADYFRVGEHSAQQSGPRLQQLEGEFKAGTLNVLSCSTTMEMGVDIGGLTGVAMNNAPPGPANFRQRAGRAGRRGEAAAFSFTLCKSDPHGEAVFANPLWAFTERTYVPRVSLQSERIVQRHINALALTRFLVGASTQLTKLNTGWFFEGGAGTLSPSERFEAWLMGASAGDASLQAGIGYLARRTVFDGMEVAKLLASCALQLRSVRERWQDEVRALEDELAAFGAPESEKKPSPAQLAVTRQLERCRGEYLLRELTSRGFLPGHGFPTDVVSFIPTTLEELRRRGERKRDGSTPSLASPEREDGFGRQRGYPSRDLALAIRDYAPGSDIVLDGQVFRSGGVTLNWHLPPTAQDVRELQAFRIAWRCRLCGASDTRSTSVAECPACGADESHLRRHAYLEPAGFAVDIRYQSTNDLTQRAYVPVHQPWISAGLEQWLPLPRLELGRYRYSPVGSIFHRSKGHAGHGFAICLRCGRGASEEAPPLAAALPADLVDHRRLRGGREQDGNTYCKGNDEPWAIKRHQWLGAAFHTDVFELQLRDLATGVLISQRPAVFSIAVAMRQALAEVLGVNQREIGCVAVPSRDDSGASGWSVVLFDTAAGGAGFVRAAQSELSRLLVRARDILTCRRQCDAACHGCLLAYDTQHQVDDLNRHAALRVLTSEVVEGLELPESLRFFGPASQLEFERLPAALTRECQRTGTREVRLYLGGTVTDWEPFEWPIRQALFQFQSAGGCVRLIAPKSVLTSLPPEAANPLASLIEAGGFELRQIDIDAADPNVPCLVAECEGADGTIRWASATTQALAPGLLWGAGEEDERVVRFQTDEKLRDVPGAIVAPGALRRRDANVVREVRVGSELNGDVKSLGKRFWTLMWQALPELETRLRRAPALTRVVFRDRYVRSPLTMRMLAEVIRGLESLPGGLADGTSVHLETATLGSQATYRTPDRIWHDWQHETTRREVFKRVVAPGRPSRLGASPLRQAAHHRELVLEWADASWVVRLDQGLGFLSASSQVSFGFDAQPESQARQLAEASFVVGNQGGYPALLYLSALKVN